MLANYFLLSVITFSGIIAGMSLIKIAPEEQMPLKKYFIWVKKIFIILMFAVLIFFYIFDILLLLLGIILLIPSLFIEFKSKENLRKMAEIYALLGILFFLSLSNQNLLAINSSLIFLYGMSAGSIIHKKNYIKMVFFALTFLVVSNLLFLVNYFW